MRVLLPALLLALGMAVVDAYPNFDGIIEFNDILKTSTYGYYRLPTAVRPEKYVLKVITHLENPNNLTFVGEVKIYLKVLESTQNITLHAQNLTIDQQRITLKPHGRTTRLNCVRSTDVNLDHDYYIMHLCEMMYKGEEYVLTMPFAGVLNQKLRGYYRSSYVDKTTNRTRWLSVTQFEPAYARSAFPCFDEPDFKASFIIVLGHEKKYTALSNMPLMLNTPMGDHKEWVWSEFQASVPMSTYLVAYTINDFANVPSNVSLKSQVRFRTWARRDAIDQCHYASVVGPKVLQYYEDIFNIKFPLPKIDQMAVPDFGAGAMENWGLVTYRETALLYAQNVSSVENKQRVASVIAHELAHQWFGNLVTMKWWTDLWLNEGFATYIASLGVEHISPEWHSLQDDSVDNTLTIFKLDALKSSHPISQPIHHASEIYEIFDSISYKKGSAVLRMMHLFLGNSAFHAGVHKYLQTHAYGNAEQDNLWQALTETALKYRSIPNYFNIKTVMDSWTLQTGYPIVIVTRDYDDNSATVSQMRYLLDNHASRSEDHSCWWVPLSYTTQLLANFSHTAPQSWLECDDSIEGIVTKTLQHMPTPNEWVLFNVQLAGLYKVKYDDRNWNLLIETLKSDSYHRIHVINRAQLIDDALSLAWSGDQDYNVAMRLIDYLRREHDYIPWKAALDNLASVNRILRQTPDYEFFKKYIQKIIAPIYLYLHGLNATSPSSSSITTLHKVLVASWACRFEVDDCVPRSLAYFRQWRQMSYPDIHNPIPIDLRSVIYCTAMRHGSDDDWQFLWRRYLRSNVATEKKTIISTLGCTREVYLLHRYLEMAFEEGSEIRKQDSSYAFGSVARHDVGFHLARDFFLSNIELLHDFYEPDSSHLGRLLSPLASQMTSQREYETVKQFVTQHKKLLSKTTQGVRRALETIQLNVQWKARNYNDISLLLRNRLHEEEEEESADGAQSTKVVASEGGGDDDEDEEH